MFPFSFTVQNIHLFHSEVAQRNRSNVDGRLLHRWPTLTQIGDGGGRHGDALDGALVAAPADPEVAVLAPLGAPAVLHDPELLATLWTFAVAHQQHGVVGQLEGVVAVFEAGVVVDALLVVHEVLVDLQGGATSR